MPAPSCYLPCLKLYPRSIPPQSKSEVGASPSVTTNTRLTLSLVETPRIRVLMEPRMLTILAQLLTRPTEHLRKRMKLRRSKRSRATGRGTTNSLRRTPTKNSTPFSPPEIVWPVSMGLELLAELDNPCPKGSLSKLGRAMSLLIVRVV